MIATGSRRSDIAGRLRTQANQIEKEQPHLTTHLHLRDAARALDQNNSQGAARHITAAMHTLTPLSLLRHGVKDDLHHTAAKMGMDQINRHLLMVKDLQELEDRARVEKESGALARADQSGEYAPPKAFVVPGAAPAPGAPPASGQAPAAKAPGKPAVPAQRSAPPAAAQKTPPAVTAPAGGPKTKAQLAACYLTAIELADRWQEAIELSAQTGALSSIHRPFGKPGGPGLWHDQGLELPAYIQNIAHALLRTGRAKTLSQAIAIAKAATSRWEKGKNTSPEVRAASAKTNAEWEADRAKAHAHASTVIAQIELAFHPGELRNAHGEWTHIGSDTGKLAFSYQGQPGSFAHIRAVMGVGDKYKGIGDLATPNTGPGADVLSTSMHAAARFMAMRQMDLANRALDSADWAARHVSPQAQSDVRAVRRSFAAVPKGVTGPIPSRQNFYQTQPAGGYSTIQAATEMRALELAIELAATAPSGGRSGAGQKGGGGRPQSSNWQNEARVPKGQVGGGRFGSGGQGQAGKKMHHGAHGGNHPSPQRRAQIMQKIASLRAEIHALLAQLPKKSSSSKSGKASSSKAASSKSSSTAAKSKSSTPAKKGTPRKKTLSPQTIHARVAALRGQIMALRAQL